MKHLKLQRGIGRKGEDIACRFLMKHGYTVVTQNYLKKWGEIDIVAKKSSKYHFIEVKTVSCENIRAISMQNLDVYRPEDNIHLKKIDRIRRVVQSYLLEFFKDGEVEWQFDVVTVLLDLGKKEAKVSVIDDIVL